MPDQARRLFAGGSGFSYKEWCGTFYPDKMKAEDMLGVVRRAPAGCRDQQHLLPDAADRDAARLGRQHAEHFRFAIKASRRITHIARLKGEDTPDSVRYLYGQLAALGAKRGPVLFQLPPNLKKDLPRLNDFLQMLPARAWSRTRVPQ